MQENPIALNTDIQRLLDAEYQVTIEGNYVIVDNVPYLSAAGVVSRGALISAYTVVNGSPDTGDHTVWFTGSMPYRADGTSLENAIHAGAAHAAPETIAGRAALCRFSNYPDIETQAQMRTDVFVKMRHYIRRLEGFVAVVDPTATATSARTLAQNTHATVFHYPNPAVARSGLEPYENKLKLKRVAIVGLGGTGAYILDALAKTPVAQIVLFDDDVIEAHNAFRLPGAIPGSMVTAGLRKTEYLVDTYHHLRGGIESQPFRVDASNVHLLDECSFVFIAVDHGPSRRLIAEHLFAKAIPFIDVGIGVEKVPEEVKLMGRARVTLVAGQSPEHYRLIEGLPSGEDAGEEVYNNIQLVELNALNAMLAVVKYKQLFGFYTEEIPSNSLKFILSWNQLRAS